MGSLFKDLSTSLARFVYAWLVPSATAVAIFALFVLPDLRGSAPGITPDSGVLSSVALFSLAVLLLSVLFAYTSLPIYRVLEGHTIPKRLKRTLLKRRLRHWYQLRAELEVRMETGSDWYLVLEQLASYPRSAEAVLPTRLGNALRAMEWYGDDRYGLDSQTLWYELQSVTSDTLRRETEDARAGVDVFVSAVIHLALLVLAATAVAVVSGEPSSAGVGVIALALMPAAYKQAVQNVSEYRATVQAVVNTGRENLAAALGLRLPTTFKTEREVWEAYVAFVNYGQDDDEYLPFLDGYRKADPVGEAG